MINLKFLIFEVYCVGFVFRTLVLSSDSFSEYCVIKVFHNSIISRELHCEVVFVL